jgi:uncharacterized membrane protein
MNRKAKRGRSSRPSLWMVRVLFGHMRLWIAIAVAGLAFGVLTEAPITGNWTMITRALIAWDIGLLLYLGAAAVMMARSSRHEIQEHSDAQDEGAFALMILTVTAALASLGAILAELAEAKHAQLGGWPYVLAIGTVILSWAFTHTIFAIHYAYEYYGDSECSGGLKFPGDDDPDYWDFVYFAFVIGMTFQVSDVAITEKTIRRSVIAHGVVAFFFNATVIALSVNMAANAM